MQRFALLACVIAATAPNHAQTSSSSSPQAAPANSHPITKSRKNKKSRKSASSRKRGQQKIDAQRTTEIQAALVREHYMSGKPSGVWDNATQQALQKYQADNGWQSKTTPDARALIKLGLGPDHDHLLNPESAMTSQPPAPSLPAKAEPSGSAQPQK